MIDQEKDWLSQELKYESKLSAWDLDEPYKVKKAHKDNCPRENLAKQHSQIHEGNESGKQIQSRTIKSSASLNNAQSKQAQSISLILSLLLIIVFLIVLINVL